MIDTYSPLHVATDPNVHAKRCLGELSSIVAHLEPKEKKRKGEAITVHVQSRVAQSSNVTNKVSAKMGCFHSMTDSIPPPRVVAAA